jgi:hypothetical protein
MAFLRARSASARELAARLGVGVLLRLLSEPFAFRLMPESRGCGAGAGFLPAAGRFTGGCGGVGLARAAPFCAGGGGGARGAAAGAGGGAGAAISSTYAAGTHA